MTSKRHNLGNATLWRLLSLPCIAVVLSVVGVLLLPEYRIRPGSVWLQTSAAAGAVLLLVPFLFVFHKRGGNATQPTRWFVWHVVISLIGMCLVIPHAIAGLQGPPLFLLLALAVLALSGAVARITISRWLADTPGSRLASFDAGSPEIRNQLQQVVERKTDLLAQLEPDASEALFSVTLQHWLSSPRLALHYVQLTRREAGLIGTRTQLPLLQAWWRPLHMIVAWLFLLGLFVHVIVVTFFAGYVADGEIIYWWHLADW